MRGHISKRRLKIMERRGNDAMGIIGRAIVKEMEARFGNGAEVVRVDSEREPGVIHVWVNLPAPVERIDVEVHGGAH